MEENNRKGPGVFYAVVGVATLVVAIIGATFAYFSASTNAEGDTIQGNTLDVSSADLAVRVDKVTFTNKTVTTNLAPALVGTSGIANPSALTEAHVKAMLNANCEEANKYTGCHVWKITANNNNTNDAITHANILLDLAVTVNDGGDKSQWGYAVFTATGDVAAASVSAVTYAEVPSGSQNHGSLSTALDDLDIHNNKSLAANGEVVYYLMVFLNDDKAVQNAEEPATGTSTDARGSYQGSVTLKAMDGEVRATFTVA